MIVFVYGQDKAGGIGKDNALPWNLPNDMKHFKETTMGHTIVMGRKTFESMGQRQLPGRKSIVVTRSEDYGKDIEGLTVVHDLDEIRQMSQEETLMVIGGSEIFLALMDDCELIIRTVIDEDFDCDTFMPELDQSVFQLIESKDGIVDEKNKYKHRFEKWKRRV